MARMVSNEVYAPIPLTERVEAYASDNDLSVSAAWRELAEAGLEVDGA